MLFKKVLKRPFYYTKPENLPQGPDSVPATRETQGLRKARAFESWRGGRSLGGGAGVAKKRGGRGELRKPRPALLYGTRPASPGALKPANMVDICFLSQGLTALAGLLLLPFGSLAASQIEVGVRPSEQQGPAGDSCVVALSVQQMSDTQPRREASWNHPSASY